MLEKFVVLDSLDRTISENGKDIKGFVREEEAACCHKTKSLLRGLKKILSAPPNCWELFWQSLLSSAWVQDLSKTGFLSLFNYWGIISSVRSISCTLFLTFTYTITARAVTPSCSVFSGKSCTPNLPNWNPYYKCNYKCAYIVLVESLRFFLKKYSFDIKKA